MQTDNCKHCDSFRQFQIMEIPRLLRVEAVEHFCHLILGKNVLWKKNVLSGIRNLLSEICYPPKMTRLWTDSEGTEGIKELVYSK